ncbi:MAG: hypothetical protein ACXVXH_15475 [Nocardioidaceae bacterium]
MRPSRPRPALRLLLSTGVAAGAVLIATAVLPDQGTGRDGADLLQRAHTVAATVATQGGSVPGPTSSSVVDEALPHVDAPGSPMHVHNPAFKNSLSQATGDAVTPDTVDPTTPEQAARALAAVRAQRREPLPKIVPLAQQPGRAAVPQDRYAMAGGCYALRGPGGWVRRTGDGYAATASTRSGGEPLHFQATDLGSYLLFASPRDFLARTSSGPAGLGGEAVGAAAGPSGKAVWKVARSGSSYTFTSGGRALAVGNDGTLRLADRATPFALHTTDGCAHWPEIGDSMTGRTFRGTSAIQEVRGYVDAHTHGMAFEFLGGDVHCGRPWHPYGVAYALKDCPDHYVANGDGAVLENFLRTGNPAQGHDPVGWPSFKDWPAPDSLTHEGTYYRWMERAWRGGLRVFTNLLVENDQLCKIYPIKRNSCDDMTSIRLQAKDMHRLERYIDAQYGGPGKGWYRIVTSPYQARKVINEGKLAVVMGIETSVLFGCTMKEGVPAPSCTKASIDRQLDQVHAMGVRQMELVNKFDNALSGVAGDQGSTGVAVNAANFMETGSFWRMRACPAGYAPGVHDKEQIAAPAAGTAPSPMTQRDALFGAIEHLFGGSVAIPAAPLYAPAPHCNSLGLTDLGAYTIRGMAKRHMLFDPDHMSVSARKASLTLVERMRYSGVVSSHSWSTPDAYPRIYRLGGFVTPYAGDSTGFVAKWKQHLRWADPRYYFGFGYGADMNGLGAQGDPRGADAPNPVTYPFTALGGVTVHKQVSGTRVYDINKDGVAHYGLYPDWIEDLRHLAGPTIVADMARGPEAYLETWERADGVSNDGCRDPRAIRPAAVIRSLPRGASARYVLRHAGQPHTRLGDTFGYCATTPSGGRTTVRVLFDGAGRVVRTG